MALGNLRKKLAIQKFVSERKDAGDNTTELLMAKGKQIKAHFEAHAVITFVVGELDESQDLLNHDKHQTIQ